MRKYDTIIIRLPISNEVWEVVLGVGGALLFFLGLFTASIIMWRLPVWVERLWL